MDQPETKQTKYILRRLLKELGLKFFILYFL